jgi:hypothetical protein
LLVKLTANSAGKSCSEMDGGVNCAGASKIFKSIIFSREAGWAMTQRKT